MFLHTLKILSILILIDTHLINSFSNSNFGPFDVSIRNVSFCRGPKRRECCGHTSKIINDTCIEYDMDVKENASNIHGHIYAISETKQSIKLQMKNMCNHPFFGPFMEKFYTFENCQIVKKHYHFFMNVQDLLNKYYGGSFIYGKWTFKSVLFTDNTNFACNVVDVALVPKQTRT